MTLDEFVKKQKANLDEFQTQWLAQIKNANEEFPDWMDFFWAWSEQKWEKESRE